MGGLGKFGVSCQGMWAKSLKHGSPKKQLKRKNHPNISEPKLHVWGSMLISHGVVRKDGIISSKNGWISNGRPEKICCIHFGRGKCCNDFAETSQLFN